MRPIALAVLVTLLAQTALAVQPDEVLPDPAQEARARAISRELRCLVCQSQSIDDSEAELARDLRLIVRERIKAGDSDAAVEAYIAARYGDYVRMTPPVKPATLILWLGPALALILGSVIFYGARRRKPVPATPLSPEEERKLSAALARLDGQDRP